MKVLHVIPGIAPRYGGPSEAIVEMCRALQERGVEVLIATTDADGKGRLAVENGRPATYRSVPTIFFPRQLSEAFKYSHPLACWLDRNVAGFDVVHIHAVFSHSSIAAAFCCIRKKIPYIVRPLGSLDPWSLNQKRAAKAILWRIAVKRMLEHAAAVHYTSEEEKRLAERRLGINSGTVVPLGVHQNSEHEESGDLKATFADLGTAPHVLMLSRIHPKKNIEALLKAFSHVARLPQYKHWKLVIGGDGEADYVKGLKQIAGQSCGDKVVFTGWVEGTPKAAVLKGANVFVLPSFQENFGLSMVEAMSYGVPVLVSTQVNLAEEIAAAGAGWVVDLERGSLRDTLTEALRDEKERSIRGAAAEKLVRSRYTWPAVAKALCALYDQVKNKWEAGSDVLNVNE